MQPKQQELNSMVRQQQKKQFSSDQQQNKSIFSYLLSSDQIFSKTIYKKPLKNTYSDPSQSSDSNHQQSNKINPPYPISSKPPQQQPLTILKQIQQDIKWDKNQLLQIQILSKLQQKGIKDKKIKQLASKFKSLNLAFEKQKIQKKNLQNQINSIIKNNQQSHSKNSVDKKQKKQRKSLEKTNTTNCSNCQQNDKKIMDFRLKNQNLKSQLNKAMRVLSRQLGQDFNIDDALREQSSWKGRQQKIQKQKSRIKQLQDRLNTNGITTSNLTNLTQITTPPPTMTRTSALLAQSKKKQLDNLKTQVTALKSQNQILQGKIKSLLSRKSILQNQLKQSKNQFNKKIQILVQKSNNDDKFIQLLKNQNNKIKKQQQIVTKIIYKQDNNQIIYQLKKQIDSLKKKIIFLQSNNNNNINKNNQDKQSKKINKDINSIGIIPPQKKKKVQQQYVNSDKYLNKMSAHDEEQLYKNWKNNLSKKN